LVEVGGPERYEVAQLAVLGLGGDQSLLRVGHGRLRLLIGEHRAVVLLTERVDLVAVGLDLGFEVRGLCLLVVDRRAARAQRGERAEREQRHDDDERRARQFLHSEHQALRISRTRCVKTTAGGRPVRASRNLRGVSTVATA